MLNRNKAMWARLGGDVVAGPTTTSSTTGTRPARTGPRRRPGDLGIRPWRLTGLHRAGDGRPERGSVAS